MGFVSILRENLNRETWLPDIYKEFASISALSIAINRGAYLRYSKRRIYPNTYILLIGSSGTGKGVVIDDVVRSLIDEINSDLILGDSATPEALLDVLSQRSKGAILVDEATMVISKRDYMREMTDYLTYLYNAHKDHIVIRRRGKNKTYIIERPYLNLLLGVQPRIMHKLLNYYDIASGFLQRFYLVYATPEEEKPVQEDEETWDRAIQLLSDIHNFFRAYISETGTPLKMHLTDEAQIKVRDYIRKVEKEYKDEELPIFSRWRDLTLKLAIVYHIDNHSESITLRNIMLPSLINIDTKAVDRAISTMEVLRVQVEAIIQEILKSRDRRIYERFVRQLKRCDLLRLHDGWYILRRDLLRRTGYTIERARPYIRLLEEEGYITGMKIVDKKVLLKVDKTKLEGDA